MLTRRGRGASIVVRLTETPSTAELVSWMKFSRETTVCLKAAGLGTPAFAVVRTAAQADFADAGGLHRREAGHRASVSSRELFPRTHGHDHGQTGGVEKQETT